MTVSEDEWHKLESPQGVPGRSSLRLHPESQLDIFLAVSHPSRQRMLVLRADARSADPIVRSVGRLPRAAGIEMNLSAVSRLEYELQVILTANDLSEVFNPLVADVADVAKAAPDATEALSAAVERFGRWQDLLRAVSRDGLSVEARRGLYGELLMLGDVLFAELSQPEAVEAWTGPTGTNQDFELPDVAIETKASTAKRPRSIRIASERQLDGTGTSALLLTLVQLDERRGGTGESLNRRVEHVRQQLSDPTARARFDGLLIQAGYLPGHRDLYDEPRYTLRDLRFWHVRDEFPRLVEADLPDGVGDCSYHLDVSALGAYRAEVDEVKELIGGSNG
ncbi:PD-(D/E)XK motif protein [Streptomyces sp. NPDC001599]|uniref:PD-(D/E)XK motif protein n=1 Tax=Streptomyces sp. NPDC001599 TaxID=3364591 RepID=UPI0036CCDD93